MSDYRLDILVPSRGRPRSVMRLREAIDGTAAHPERIVLRVRVDDDDPRREEYLRLTARREGIVSTVGPRIRLAASWDEQAAQAEAAGATHIAMWGDDNIPVTPGWDRLFVELLDERGPGFVYGRDGVWDHTYNRDVPEQLILPTATLWPISMYRMLGWVSPPGLTHLCIDLAWRDLGVAAGCLWLHPLVTIRHFHRCVGAADDATYREANDDPVQYAADKNGHSAWRNGPRFADDLAKVRVLRELWSAGVTT